MWIRTGHCWTLCVFNSPTTTRVTLSFTPPYSLVILNMRVTCEYRHCHLCQSKCIGPIAKTWCLSDPLASLKARFSWGWITSGSASCCYCLKSVQWPTQGCMSTSVLLFLCWRSTKDHGNQVIFRIFSIFCIFCILYMIMSSSIQNGWIGVNPPSSTSAVNNLKSCM